MTIDSTGQAKRLASRSLSTSVEVLSFIVASQQQNSRKGDRKAVCEMHGMVACVQIVGRRVDAISTSQSMA